MYIVEKTKNFNIFKNFDYILLLQLLLFPLLAALLQEVRSIPSQAAGK